MEGKNWLIVGKTGSGKSYFARELIRRSKKPYKVIVDISNEYSKDRQFAKYGYVYMGRENAYKGYDFVRLIEEKKNVLFEVGDMVNDELVFFLNNLAYCIPSNTLLVIDEAHQFFPRYRYSIGLERLLRTARKYNIDIVMVTQMIVDLNLVALKQARILVVFQMTEENELKKLKNYIENAEEVLPELKRGQKIIKDLKTGQTWFEDKI